MEIFWEPCLGKEGNGEIFTAFQVMRFGQILSELPESMALSVASLMSQNATKRNVRVPDVRLGLVDELQDADTLLRQKIFGIMLKNIRGKRREILANVLVA